MDITSLTTISRNKMKLTNTVRSGPSQILSSICGIISRVMRPIRMAQRVCRVAGSFRQNIVAVTPNVTATTGARNRH